MGSRGVAPALAGLVLASAVLAAAERVTLGLDHVPVAVADLDSAAAAYRALGFALKPGRPHANGIRNLHVKFRDGTEVELITAPEARDTLTAAYRRHLAAGDGPAFLALFSPSRERAAAALRSAGFAPRATPALVTLAAGDSLGYVFLGARNHSPSDRPEHFAHENTAQSLIAVWLAQSRPDRELRLLAALGARPSGDAYLPPLGARARRVPLAGGEIYLLPGKHQLVPGRPIMGLTLRVRDVEEAVRCAERAGLVRPRIVSHERGRSLFVPPGLARGYWLELRQDRAAGGRRGGKR